MTVAARNSKLSRLPELSKLWLRGSSKPLARNIFVERPSKRDVKKSAKKESCVSVLQKNSVSVRTDEKGAQTQRRTTSSK